MKLLSSKGIYSKKRRKTLEQIIETIESNCNLGKAVGSDIDITDALNWQNQGISVGGHATQDVTSSPDIPATIVNEVTGTQNVAIRSKNLIPEGSVFTISGTKNVQIHLPAGKYTFSWDYSVSDVVSTNGLVQITYTDGTTRNITIPYGKKSLTQTFGKDVKSLFFYVVSTYNASIGHTRIVYNFMIEEGVTATQYVPYINKEVGLHLGNNILKEAGDYRDRIVKIENKWYLQSYIDTMTLNGTEDWQYSSGQIFYLDVTPNYVRDGLMCLCDRFEAQHNVTSATYLTQDKSIAFYSGTTNSRLYLRYDDMTTVEDLKTWLSNNNAILYYAKANRINTEITDETLIAELEELLKKIQTYSGETKIVVTTSEGNPAQLEVTYLKDDRIETKQTLAEMQAQILALAGGGEV